MKGNFYLVTGGTGFLGSSLVCQLVENGAKVRVLDNHSRGNPNRLKNVVGDLELVRGDIRDPQIVQAACSDVDAVIHLAYINGTEFFYKMPELILEVAVQGMMNVINGCRYHGVRELILASSSEVYQVPDRLPTDEGVPLVVPDPLNPRYSYGGGKIISELLAINFGRTYFDRVLIFRPHNVYGPDMGFEHVIPQLAMRINKLPPIAQDEMDFPIQGTGEETRAFIFIDDFTRGLIRIIEQGQHLNIYNIGTQDEVSIYTLAKKIAQWSGRRIRIVPGKLQPGSTPRRCPDITKLRSLGFEPEISLDEGLDRTLAWYATTS